MIYLYLGTNSFLLEEKLRVFKERYLAKFSNSLNVHYIDVSEGGASLLKEVSEGRSLFNETVLVFVFGFSNKEDADALSTIFSDYDVAERNDIVVVLHASVPQKSIDKKLIDYCAKNGKIEMFEPFIGVRLVRWVQSFGLKEGIDIPRESALKLIGRRGENMVALSQEIKKLSAYLGTGVVSEDLIDRLVQAKNETDVFKTIGALARRDSAAAISLLWDHRKKGDDPLQILGMFAYQVRTLLLIKDADENGTERIKSLKPYVVQKNRPLSRAFEKDELISLHSLIAEADYYVKTGEEEAFNALEDVVLAFS